ncbi:MAG: peptidoglycan DD-metalloendopeptidase family protein [Rikenellaceae bacterium]|nr:peptidoglycan DD-metalloendopeptidase family protein [Rikenellaceae bacterium]
MAELPKAEPIAEPAPIVLSPRTEIVFPESETQHVRLTNYNPFEGQSRIELPTDILAREFCYPYPGKKISPYGMRGRSMHTGVDIKAAPSDIIRAAFPGVVRMAKLYSGYGNVIVIRHYSGLESVYAHNTKNLVGPNDVVEAGTPIALAGRTGRATTEHLHFELRIMGEPFDPELLLDTEHRCLRQGTLVLAMANGKATTSFTSGGTSPDWLAQQAGQMQPASAVSETTRTAAASVHIVKKGDTLYQIARRNGTTVAALCRLNGITERSILHPGVRINVR